MQRGRAGPRGQESCAGLEGLALERVRAGQRTQSGRSILEGALARGTGVT